MESLNLFNVFLLIDLFLLQGCLGMLTYLLTIRYRRTVRQRRKELLIYAVDKKINQFLISSSENEGARLESVSRYQVRELSRFISSDAQKDALVKRLLQLKSEVHGEFDAMLTDLYSSLRLFDRSVAKVNSSSVLEKVEGVNEIIQFDHSPARHNLKELFQSSIVFVRQMAQIATLRTSPNGSNPLTFLSSNWNELTEWHQLQIHAELSQITSKHMIGFEDLLLHPSLSVKIFALKLSIFYQKVEYMATIRGLLPKKLLNIRIWVLRAIGEMGDERDVAPVVSILKESKNDYEIRECLSTLSHIGGSTELEIIGQYCQSNVRSHRIGAVAAIQKVTNNAREFIYSSFSDPLSNELLVTLNHIEEPLNSVA